MQEKSGIITWHLEERFLEDLKPHPHNPRFLSKDEAKALKESIKKFGLIDRPVITYDGIIIGGHQRVRIMQDMGIKQCECWVIDGDLELSREQVDELNIRLNKNTGAWDWEILANDWDVNLLCEWGFKPDDFEDVLPKGKKKQVIFEFTQDEDLDSFVSEFNKAFYHLNDSDKFKMKVKK